MKTKDLFCIECDCEADECAYPQEHAEEGFHLDYDELREHLDKVARDTAAETLFEFKRGN